MLFCAISLYAGESEEPSKMDMVVNKLDSWGFSPWIIVLLLSAMPVFELRGGLPVALVVFKMSLWKALPIAILGNMLPVIPYYVFLDKFTDVLMEKSKLCNKLLNWIFHKTRTRTKIIQKYEEIGLVCFVGIPLPMTGAWTGTSAAFLFNLKKKKSFALIFVGVVLASIIVSVVTLSGVEVFNFLIKH